MQGSSSQPVVQVTVRKQDKVGVWKSLEAEIGTEKCQHSIASKINEIS